MKKYIRSSEPLYNEKIRLREIKKRQIDSLTDDYIRESDSVIFRRLCELREFKNADTVFAYFSVGREVSTEKLIAYLRRSGRRLALPVCGENGAMEFHISNGAELIPGRFGIPEPPAVQPVTPEKNDIIIVPALCCDRYGNRLGHGMGYYDRYLSKYRAFSVCLCRKLLLEEKIPTEDTDAAVSLVLTD